MAERRGARVTSQETCLGGSNAHPAHEPGAHTPVGSKRCGSLSSASWSREMMVKGAVGRGWGDRPESQEETQAIKYRRGAGRV